MSLRVIFWTLIHHPHRKGSVLIAAPLTASVALFLVFQAPSLLRRRESWCTSATNARLRWGTRAAPEHSGAEVQPERRGGLRRSLRRFRPLPGEPFLASKARVSQFLTSPARSCRVFATKSSCVSWCPHRPPSRHCKCGMKPDGTTRECRRGATVTSSESVTFASRSRCSTPQDNA
jgi:hypothetical protein